MYNAFLNQFNVSFFLYFLFEIIWFVNFVILCMAKVTHKILKSFAVFPHAMIDLH